MHDWLILPIELLPLSFSLIARILCVGDAIRGEGYKYLGNPLFAAISTWLALVTRFGYVADL